MAGRCCVAVRGCLWLSVVARGGKSTGQQAAKFPNTPRNQTVSTNPKSRRNKKSKSHQQLEKYGFDKTTRSTTSPDETKGNTNGQSPFANVPCSLDHAPYALSTFTYTRYQNSGSRTVNKSNSGQTHCKIKKRAQSRTFNKSKSHQAFPAKSGSQSPARSYNLDLTR